MRKQFIIFAVFLPLLLSLVVMVGCQQRVETPPTTYTNNIVKEQDLFLEIVSVTSPIGKGYIATLRAKTEPQTYCTIVVYYKSGRSKASGLYPKETDSSGNVSWSWKVGTRTTSGSWRIVVTASLGGKTASQTTYFTVY